MSNMIRVSVWEDGTTDVEPINESLQAGHIVPCWKNYIHSSKSYDTPTVHGYFCYCSQEKELYYKRRISKKILKDMEKKRKDLGKTIKNFTKIVEELDNESIDM